MENLLQKALAFHQAGNYAEAEALYRSALKNSAHDQHCNFLYGTLKFQTGDLEEALRYLTRAVNINPAFTSALNNLGLAYQAMGNYGQALYYYKKAVDVNPQYTDARMNIGVIYQALEKDAEAVEQFSSILQYDPFCAEAYFNLALCRTAKKMFREAIPDFEKAIERRPDYAEAINGRGVCYKELEMYEAAKADFLKTLELVPTHYNARYNLALIALREKEYLQAKEIFTGLVIESPQDMECHARLGEVYLEMNMYQEALNELKLAIENGAHSVLTFKQAGTCSYYIGDYKQAVYYLNRALSIEPENGELLNNLAMIYQAKKEFGVALSYAELAYQYMPYSSEIVNNLGVISEQNGNYDAAATHFKRAIELDSDNVDPLYNLGNIYLTLQKYEEAAGYYHQALRLNEFYFKAHNNLGVVYQQLDDLEQSELYLRRGLEIQPAFPELLNNLGNTLRMQNSLAEAKKAFELAIETRPKFAEAHKNLGMTFLLEGQYEKGWQEFEWRWKVELKKRNYDKPEWNGELIRSKRLLVYTEQGLGDTLQFIRFLKEPTEAGMEVILQCQDELVSMLDNFPFANKVVPESEPISEDSFDYHVPLMSVPMHLQVNEQKIESLPYLFPARDRVAYWQNRLPQTTNLRVGLVWAGNKNHKNDRNRSIKLSELEKLFNISHVQYISLQKGEAESQAKQYGEKILCLGDELKNFTDTTAILSVIDVLISVDTAVVHAAGSIGALAWLLLPYSPDWRWQLNTEKTPWYRNMRLFRREAGHSWQAVTERLKNELENLKTIKHN